MGYQLKCRNCHQPFYLEQVSDDDTDYKCPHCQASNWIDSSFHGLKEISKDDFDNKIIDTKESSPDVNNTKKAIRLSDKFRGLETFKSVLIIGGILYTIGFIVMLSNLPRNTPEELTTIIFIGGLITLLLTWYSITNLSKIINFLFELDLNKSDKK